MGAYIIQNKAPASSASNSFLQKKELSNHADKLSKPPFIRPKLTIGSPNDVYEKEADTMSDKVVRMHTPEPINFSSSKNVVNRKCAKCEEDGKLQRKETGHDSTNMAPPIVHDVLNSSSGRSLDADTRSFMEPRFNYDFSNVKVHDSELAANSAKSINALAYTSENNIVFNSGQYNTNSDSGKRLLAHELSHVVQQGKGVEKSIQRDLAIEPAHPEAAEPQLTAQEIRDAITFNTSRYNQDNITLIQNIVGGPVTGILTEETIRLIALYQAQNGLNPDGKVGPRTFDQLTAELGAENASPDTCLTMFHVGLVTPMELHAAGPNLANIFGHFNVDIRFSPHCDCSRFQYRQFISGLVTYNGANINNQFGTIPGGAALPAISNWVEDGNTNLPNNGRYGHRNHLANQGVLNQYTDANGGIDMQNGCRYQSFDEPGVIGAPANAGDVYVFDFRFFGDIRKDGRMIERKFWAVRETVTIP